MLANFVAFFLLFLFSYLYHYFAVLFIGTMLTFMLWMLTFITYRINWWLKTSWRTINKRKLHNRFRKEQAFLYQVQCVLLPRKLRLTSAFVGVWRIAPDKERLVLWKPVVQFSFSYGVSRGILYICLLKCVSLILNNNKRKF